MANAQPPPQATTMAAVTNFLHPWIRRTAQDASQLLTTFSTVTADILRYIFSWRYFFKVLFIIGLSSISGMTALFLLVTVTKLSMVEVGVTFITVLVVNIRFMLYINGSPHTIRYLRRFTSWMAAENRPFRNFWFEFGFEFLTHAMFNGSFPLEIILAAGIITFVTFFKLVAVREDSNRVATAVVNRCAMAAIFVWLKGYGLFLAMIPLVPAAIGGISLLPQTDVEINLVQPVA